MQRVFLKKCVGMFKKNKKKTEMVSKCVWGGGVGQKTGVK